MLDHGPAGSSIWGWYARIETATDAWFRDAEAWLRRSARPLLQGLILFSLIVSLVACMVIAAVGAGFVGGGAQPISGQIISPEQVTETYGAEQFFIQLTAQAKDPRYQSRPVYINDQPSSTGGPAGP